MHKLTYSEIIKLGPSFFPFVVDYGYNRDRILDAIDWCGRKFGRVGTTQEGLQESLITLDPSAQWACINYKFCFNDPVAATHFKLRWG
jgi:hypothetical protein